MAESYTSQVPAQAVAPDDKDLVEPTADLLRGLNLLPDEGVTAGPSAAFTGGPDSVAVMESTATAISKAWAAGLGTAVAGLWATVGTWWAKQGSDIQVGVLWAAAIATAALVLGLAYIVGSDVRGRAAATVAMLEARASLARSMMEQAGKQYQAPAPTHAAVIAALSPPLRMTWVKRKKDDEDGWVATASRFVGDSTDYWLVKGSEQAWVPADQVEIVS